MDGEVSSGSIEGPSLLEAVPVTVVMAVVVGSIPDECMHDVSVRGRIKRRRPDRATCQIVNETDRRGNKQPGLRWENPANLEVIYKIYYHNNLPGIGKKCTLYCCEITDTGVFGEEASSFSWEVPFQRCFP